ncbi:dephospho-CoA kinase [Spiroplasma eriocheiris]|uniref:Dephospho-CoA kinase n=1 Tax=Spiroplasma eriocheiris TaxID=315358 RepID=A0A0H3XLS5_9MOLU|nr:dephospho-CoA kinase [Spiroplasma eriocheiris]AHF58085.1 dephospho-CoA kinase [Spiroplasma eriocheiris CCTCC M 207170]AKM54524.1 dephospho-CoA kinase [Spiroplasma eriocheiris]
MIIGIYGYIGSGKTTASQYLVEKYQFQYINADLFAKECMQNPVVINYLRKKYDNVVNENNQINKEILRDIIFNNQLDNHDLNAVVWPLVENQTMQLLKQYHNSNVIIEAVTLNTFKIKFDYKIFITAPKKVLYTRVFERDGKSKNQTKNIIKIQKQLFGKNPHKITIHTTKEKEILYNKLDKVMTKILKES